MPHSYILKRSNRRSVTLKVVDGQVYVYAPLLEPKFLIDKMVAEHENWINRKLANPRINVNFNLEKDAFIYLLGEKYRLEVHTGTRNAIRLEEDRIVLCGKSYASITKHWRDYLINIVNEHVYEMKERTGREFTVGYRFYKGKWGCCYKQKKQIILNYLLACVPFACIDEVICHEIAHLKVANHQKAFYQELASLYPDYKKCVKILKDYTIA